jgi:hypothetical protein
MGDTQQSIKMPALITQIGPGGSMLGHNQELATLNCANEHKHHDPITAGLTAGNTIFPHIREVYRRL